MKMRDEDGHEAGLRAGKAWERIKSGNRRTWLDWTTEIGPWLVKARVEAMALAKTNRPIGKRYTAKMSEFLITYGLEDIDQTTRAHLLKIMAALPEVESWRKREKQPEDLHSPSWVWRKFQRSEKRQGRLDGMPTPTKVTLSARLNRHFNDAWSLMQAMDDWPELSKTAQRRRESLMRTFMIVCDGLRALAEQSHREPSSREQATNAAALH